MLASLLATFYEMGTLFMEMGLHAMPLFCLFALVPFIPFTMGITLVSFYRVDADGSYLLGTSCVPMLRYIIIYLCIVL